MRYLLWLLLKLHFYHILFPTRKRLARKYLLGSGIEIGALHLPLLIPEGASVKYVDRTPTEQLRKIYPELKIFRLTPVDIIDNGEALETIAPASQDFIIANHFLEHCENPVVTIMVHLSRLKHGGILYLAIPDRDKTLDRRRPITTLEHVKKDFQVGPAWFRFEHYLEWARLVENVPEDRVKARALELMKNRYSIHFHAWRRKDFSELLDYVRMSLNTGFTIQETSSCRNEFIYILRKE